MRCISRVLTLLAVLLLSACASGGGTTAAPPPVNPEAQAVNLYRIGVDDILEVSVWHNPDLNAKVPVRPDGMISVPLIGDVAAGGKTPEEVSAAITDKLKAYVRDPQVAVILTELRSHEYLSRVRVTGAVRQPISVPYRQGMTVLDAVLAAGGTTDFAAADRTELYRKEAEGATRSYSVRLDRILQKGDLATNYPAQPGDVITVPERVF
ncbi:XrtA/PEP-CTERM system exopolysaccharide export protein [Dokdonella ginsengisoli]|uniref:XrtA/PEP-CTERM system exopolysaccharide export protein n=1 Tax=Dokdonella ginsengisoli TaxID=363846 RepID=A0ABV9QSJ3_9GAMM